MEKKTVKKQNIVEFLKFGLVGISNTVVAYIVYTLVYYLIVKNIHIANFFAFVISVLNAYFWQKKFVFKKENTTKKQAWWRDILKMYISYSFTGLILTELLLILWFNVIHLENYMGVFVSILNRVNITITNEDLAVIVAPAINSIIILPISYFINKFWIFSKRKNKLEE